jgi:hypothetical protein
MFPQYPIANYQCTQTKLGLWYEKREGRGRELCAPGWSVIAITFISCRSMMSECGWRRKVWKRKRG